MTDDVLRLRNMRFYGYHGLFPEEKALGQLFEVDVELVRDLSAAGKTDDPNKTVDYVAIYRLVEEAMTGQRCKLVEALAELRAAGHEGTSSAGDALAQADHVTRAFSFTASPLLSLSLHLFLSLPPGFATAC